MTRKHHPKTVPTVWVLVADRSRARVFAAEAQLDDELSEIAAFANAAGQERPQDMDTDRQGYFRGRGGASEACEPRTDFKHQTAQQFAGELVDYLEDGRERQQFGRLVIVAAPLFLGVLREKLPGPLAQSVVLEIDKDYTQLSSGELRRHLPAEL